MQDAKGFSLWYFACMGGTIGVFCSAFEVDEKYVSHVSAFGRWLVKDDFDLVL